MWKKISLFLLVIITTLLFSGCIEQLDKRRFAGLQVTTHDIPSALYLNGEFLSDSPFKQEDLQPGNYTLRIVPDDSNYVAHEFPVTLTRGLLTAVVWNPGTRPELGGGVVFELEKITNRDITELTVSSIPDGAIVRVNDGAMEFTPMLQSDLTPGKHDISITLPSYIEQNYTLNLVAGHRLSILVKLAKEESSESTPHSEIEENLLEDERIIKNEGILLETAHDNVQATSSGTPVRTAPPSLQDSLQSSLQSNNQQATQSATINPTNFYQNNTEVLRVRSGPGSHYSEIGFAEVGKAYPYLNETTSGWLKIDLNGEDGWISQSYASLD